MQNQLCLMNHNYKGMEMYLNFIPLWEWTCHCVFYERQDWNARVVVTSRENAQWKRWRACRGALWCNVLSQSGIKYKCSCLLSWMVFTNHDRYTATFYVCYLHCEDEYNVPCTDFSSKTCASWFIGVNYLLQTAMLSYCSSCKPSTLKRFHIFLK